MCVLPYTTEQFSDTSCVSYSSTQFNTGSDGKKLHCNARDVGFDSWVGRYPGEGNGNPLCNVLAWKLHEQRPEAIVHGLQRAGHD